MASRQSDNLIASAVEERVGANHQRTRPLLNKQREGGLEIALGRRIRNDEFNTDTCGCLLHLFQLTVSNRIGGINESANGVGLEPIRARAQFVSPRD